MERPSLSPEDRAFHSLFPPLRLPAPVPTEGGAGRVGKWQINKSLCFEDEDDFQPNPVLDNLRIFHCHPHFNNTHSGDTP